MAKKIFILAAVLFVLGAILLTVGMVLPAHLDLGVLGSQSTTVAEDMKSSGLNLFDYHDGLIQLKSVGGILWSDYAQQLLTRANIAISGFSFIIISIAAGIAAFVMKSKKEEEE